jgi:hypothetical protein
VRLSSQTRVDLAHRAEEYISGLVGNHDGDRDDVLSIIDDLHHQAMLGNSDRASELPSMASDMAPLSPFRWQGENSSP